MFTIAVDMDGVIADLHTEWLRRYNEEHDDSVKPGDITKWDMGVFLKPGVNYYKYLQDETLYASVRPIDGALEGIQELRRKDFRVIFASACVPGTEPQKIRWLRRHKFLLKEDSNANDFISLRDKSLVRASVLVDDRPENIESFPGPGILYRAPYNTTYVTDHIAQDWQEVVQLVKTIMGTTKISTAVPCQEYPHPWGGF